jgi:PKD repeat protein
MNPAAGPAPLTVQFTDTSTGGGVAWAWSFGDGATSNEQNPTHTYTNPGTYRVKLVVANAIGNSSATGEVMVVEEGGSGTDSSLLSTLSELLSDRKIQILIAGGTILVLVGMASR